MFTLLHRICVITGNSNYERANLYLLNSFLHKKKHQPELYKAMLANAREVQSVILEYVHATLQSGIKDNNTNNIEELNSIIFNWQRIHEGNVLLSKRYDINVKLSYSVKSKGDEYYDACESVISELFDEVGKLQLAFESNPNPALADEFCPFVYKDKVYFCNWPRENDRHLPRISSLVSFLKEASELCE